MCGFECERCDVTDGEDAIVVEDVVVTTAERGVDDETEEVGMTLDDTRNMKSSTNY